MNKGEHKVFVSHRQGKQCETEFKRLGKYGKVELWQAQATYIRPHQVRLHAQELGFEVIGDSIYADDRPLRVGDVIPPNLARNSERVVHLGIAMHMASVSYEAKDSNESFSIEVKTPKYFTFLRT